MNTQYPVAEQTRTINGVNGRAYTVHAPQKANNGTLVHRNQKWVSEARAVDGYGTNGRMQVTIRFDDECFNGHQSFAITADISTAESRRRKDVAACGMLHEEIARYFPELAPLIKWHLCATDGPMHYVANTTYHASNLDHYGRAKGEPSSWDHVVYFGNSPVSHKIKSGFVKFLQDRMQATRTSYQTEFGKVVSEFKPDNSGGEFRVIEIAHEKTSGGYDFKPHYTFVGYGEEWHLCPFGDKKTADEWAQALNTLGATFTKIPTAVSEGKERDLAAARNCAIWPDATEAELTSPKEELTKALEARLPGLLAEFRETMNAIGFLWEV